MRKGLKAEYDALNEDNRKALRQMYHYLKARHVEADALDEITEDLLGMALECQQRGEDFSQAVGEDYETFCRELAANCRRQPGLEKGINFVIRLLWCAVTLLPAVYVYNLLFFNSQVVRTGLILQVPVNDVIKYCALAVALCFGTFDVNRFIYKSPRRVWTVFVCSLLGLILLSDVLAQTFASGKTISMNMPVLAFISLAMVALLMALRKAARREWFKGFGKKEKNK